MSKHREIKWEYCDKWQFRKAMCIVMLYIPRSNVPETNLSASRILLKHKDLLKMNSTYIK